MSTSGLTLSETLGRRHNFYCRGLLLDLRPVLDFLAPQVFSRGVLVTVSAIELTMDVLVSQTCIANVELSN